VTTFSLRSVRLRSGESYRDEREVQLDPIVLGGQRYLPVPGNVTADFTVSRASTGTVFELEFRTRLHGPCYRCTRDAVVERSVSAREYQAASPGDDEELRTAYLENDRLDLSAWARDALALAMPARILCREDCRGLCAVCGADLNAPDAADHRHDQADDPRWAKLRELKIE
jgi:uncharacterized protein